MPNSQPKPSPKIPVPPARSGLPVGSWDRFWAALVDLFILLAIIFVVGAIVDSFILQRGRVDSPSIRHLDLIYSSGIIGIAFAYFLLGNLSSWKVSMGKRLLGLKVVDVDGLPADWWRLVLRLFIKLFLVGFALALRLLAPAGLFALALFTFSRKDKRSIHDLLSGTKVVYR